MLGKRIQSETGLAHYLLSSAGAPLPMDESQFSSNFY